MAFAEVKSRLGLLQGMKWISRKDLERIWNLAVSGGSLEGGLLDGPFGCWTSPLESCSSWYCYLPALDRSRNKHELLQIRFFQPPLATTETHTLESASSGLDCAAERLSALTQVQDLPIDCLQTTFGLQLAQHESRESKIVITLRLSPFWLFWVSKLADAHFLPID